AATEKWLTSYPAPSLPRLFMSAAHARMLQRQGRVQEAWAELEPLLPSYQGSVLMRAAFVLSALGRAEEAEAVARRRLDRYHDWGSLETLLEVSWRNGNVAAAASTLAKPPWNID